MNLREGFAAGRAERRALLLPYGMAGLPDADGSVDLFVAMAEAGADGFEVGIPYADPLMDGPVIQETFTDALAQKLKLTDISRTIAEVRPGLSIPLVAMVSYSVVFRYGVARFLTNAKMSGFDGLILPDLPPPEAQKVCEQVRSAGLDTILLIAPTTPPQRRAEIASLCSGFVYYLSVAGITGERQQLPDDLSENVRQIKQLTDRPVCVGFGISKPQHVKQLAEIADGAIVGSAVARRMKDHHSEGAEAIAGAVGAYCRDLLSLVR